MAIELPDTVTVQEIWAAIQSGRVSYTSFANLQVAVARPIGSIAEVQGDAGSHEDPVSGTIVANAGVYRRVAEGWQWISVLPTDYVGLVQSAVSTYGLGTLYANVAEGLAATGVGDTFAIHNSNETLSLYLHDAGDIATPRGVLVFTTALAAEDGADLITYQHPVGTTARTVRKRLDNLPLRPEEFGTFGSDPATNRAILNLWLAALGDGVCGEAGGLDLEIDQRLLLTSTTKFNIDWGWSRIKIADGVAHGETYALMLVQMCEDFTIARLRGDGNRDGRGPLTESSGHLMRVIGNKRGRFQQVEMENGTTDNWYVRAQTTSDLDTYPTQIGFDRCAGRNAYRNNMSVIGAQDCWLFMGDWTGAIGTAPQAGIGIEPNSSDIYGVRNFQVILPNCSGNAGHGFYTGSAADVPNSGRAQLTGRHNGLGLGLFSRCNGWHVEGLIGDHPAATVPEGIIDVTAFAKNVSIDAEAIEEITTPSAGNYLVAVARGPNGSLVHDFGSIAAAGNAQTTMTVSGARIGDEVVITTSASLGGLVATGAVTAPSEVTLTVTNPTGGAIDPASMTYTAEIFTNIRVDRIVHGKCTLPALSFSAISSSVGVIDSNDCSNALAAVVIGSGCKRVRIEQLVVRRSAGYGLYNEGQDTVIENYEIEDHRSAVSAIRTVASGTGLVLRNGRIVHTSGTAPAGSVRALRLDVAIRELGNLYAPQYTTSTLITGGLDKLANATVYGITPNILGAVVVHDAASLAAGATVTFTATVPYANTTDRLRIAPLFDLQGIQASGWISAGATATVRLTNPTAGAIDLPSGSFALSVDKL